MVYGESLQSYQQQQSLQPLDRRPEDDRPSERPRDGRRWAELTDAERSEREAKQDAFLQTRARQRQERPNPNVWADSPSPEPERTGKAAASAGGGGGSDSGSSSDSDSSMRRNALHGMNCCCASPAVARSGSECMTEIPTPQRRER